MQRRLAWTNRRTRRAGAVAAALVVHALVLGGVSLAVRKGAPPIETPPVRLTLLELSPKPRPKAAKAQPDPSPTSSVIHARAPKAVASNAPPPLAVAPTAPSPSPASSAPLARDPLFTGIGEAIDCLSDPRAIVDPRCAARRARAIEAKAGPDRLMIDPAKQARWDAVLAKRRRDRNPTSPTIACTGPGSNFGTECIPPKVR